MAPRTWHIFAKVGLIVLLHCRLNVGIGNSLRCRLGICRKRKNLIESGKAVELGKERGK
jgi:hypothetical protein